MSTDTASPTAAAVSDSNQDDYAKQGSANPRNPKGSSMSDQQHGSRNQSSPQGGRDDDHVEQSSTDASSPQSGRDDHVESHSTVASSSQSERDDHVEQSSTDASSPQSGRDDTDELADLPNTVDGNPVVGRCSACDGPLVEDSQKAEKWCTDCYAVFKGTDTISTPIRQRKRRERRQEYAERDEYPNSGRIRLYGAYSTARD